MRPLYDEFDEFDFGDSAAEWKILLKMLREQRRLAARQSFGPGNKRNHATYEDDVEHYDSYGDYEEYDQHDEYDEYDKFDSGSGYGMD